MKEKNLMMIDCTWLSRLGRTEKYWKFDFWREVQIIQSPTKVKPQLGVSSLTKISLNGFIELSSVSFSLKGIKFLLSKVATYVSLQFSPTKAQPQLGVPYLT